MSLTLLSYPTSTALRDASDISAVRIDEEQLKFRLNFLEQNTTFANNWSALYFYVANFPDLQADFVVSQDGKFMAANASVSIDGPTVLPFSLETMEVRIYWQNTKPPENLALTRGSHYFKYNGIYGPLDAYADLVLNTREQFSQGQVSLFVDVQVIIRTYDTGPGTIFTKSDLPSSTTIWAQRLEPPTATITGSAKYNGYDPTGNDPVSASPLPFTNPSFTDPLVSYLGHLLQTQSNGSNTLAVPAQLYSRLSRLLDPSSPDRQVVEEAFKNGKFTSSNNSMEKSTSGVFSLVGTGLDWLLKRGVGLVKNLLG